MKELIERNVIPIRKKELAILTGGLSPSISANGPHTNISPNGPHTNNDRDPSGGS